MKKILNFSVCFILILALIIPSNLTALASGPPDLKDTAILPDDAALPSQNPDLEEPSQAPAVQEEPTATPQEPEIPAEPAITPQEPEVSAVPEASPEVSQEPEASPETSDNDLNTDLLNALNALLAEVQDLNAAEPNEAWLGSLSADITLALEGEPAKEQLIQFRERMGSYKALKSLLEDAENTLLMCQQNEGDKNLKVLSDKLAAFITDVKMALESEVSKEEVEALQAKFTELMVMPLADVSEEREQMETKLLDMFEKGKVYSSIQGADQWPDETKEIFTNIITKEIDLVADADLKQILNQFKNQPGKALQKLLNIISAEVSDYTTHCSPGMFGEKGIWIQNQSTKYYTYCSQERNAQYPESGLKYLLLEDDESIRKYAEPLSRALEAGYPLDLYGLSSLTQIPDGTKATYTQMIIWAILRGEESTGLPEDKYAMALFEYAMTGTLPKGYETIRNKASVSVAAEDLSDNVLLMYENLPDEDEYKDYEDVAKEYRYKALIHLKSDKDVTITLDSLPKGTKIVYNYFGKVKELLAGETIDKATELVYLSNEKLPEKNEIQFSYVSYQVVNQDSIKSLMNLDIIDKDGWSVYQKMIGYQLKDVAGTLSVQAEGRDEDSSETPAPDTEVPTPTPDTEVPTPTPDTEVPTPTPDTNTPAPTPNTPSGNPTPSNPTNPSTPSTPTPPSNDIDIPDEEIPQAPVDDIDIDEDIPTGPVDEEIDLDEDIPTGPGEEEVDLDEDIPTGPGDTLPQTGTVPVTVFALIGGILMACGAFFVWKKETVNK